MARKSTLVSKTLLAVGMAVMFSGPAMADIELATSLCNYTANDNKNQLRKTLSDNRLRLRNIYDGVYCNGENLVRHAIKSNAAEAAGFIVNQLPASQFSDGADLKWAESQGLADTDAAKAVKARSEG